MTSNDVSSIHVLVEAIQRAAEALPCVLEETVVRALDNARLHPKHAVVASTDNMSGTAVHRADKIDARELRDAYLLGKLPDEGGFRFHSTLDLERRHDGVCLSCWSGLNQVVQKDQIGSK